MGCGEGNGVLLRRGESGESDVVGLCSSEEYKCMRKLGFVSSASIRCCQS